MSNNPINHIDPNGEWDFGEKVKNFFQYGEWMTNAEFNTAYSETIDVYIWEKTGGRDVGHTAIKVDNDVYGYYPTDENGNYRYDNDELMNSRGQMHIDNPSDFRTKYQGDVINSFTVRVTSAQKTALLNNLNDIATNPGRYKILTGRHCTTTAMNAIGKSGIKLKTASGDLSKFLYVAVPPKSFQRILELGINGGIVTQGRFTVPAP